MNRALHAVLCVALLCPAILCRADIDRWDNGAVIPGTEGIEPGPGVQLDHRDLEFASLGGDLADANFSYSKLANARVSGTIQDADFSHTIVRGVNLSAPKVLQASSSMPRNATWIKTCVGFH